MENKFHHNDHNLKLKPEEKCASACKQCQGNCMQQAQHSGSHKCGGGHSW